jgi:hypothetical protein
VWVSKFLRRKRMKSAIPRDTSLSVDVRIHLLIVVSEAAEERRGQAELACVLEIRSTSTSPVWYPRCGEERECMSAGELVESLTANRKS